MLGRSVIAAVALSACALALPESARSAALERPSITLAVGGKTLVAFLPLTIAERLGLFEQEGLRVDIQNVQGGSRALQSLVGAAILFKLNKFAGAVALASLVLVLIYPSMKRLTSWPQLVLGLAFNWGALVGYAAVTASLSWATLALYAGGVAWTLVYDTIYAMQDQRDDAVIGVRSTARRFADAPRWWLTLFAVLALAAWVLAGVLAGLGLSYFVILLAIALHFAWQIALLKPHDQADCLRRFKSNASLGLMLTAGIIAGHLP